jgi:hypothetical protein
MKKVGIKYLVEVQSHIVENLMKMIHFVRLQLCLFSVVFLLLYLFVSLSHVVFVFVLCVCIVCCVVLCIVCYVLYCMFCVVCCVLCVVFVLFIYILW